MWASGMAIYGCVGVYVCILMMTLQFQSSCPCSLVMFGKKKKKFKKAAGVGVFYPKRLSGMAPFSLPCSNNSS